MYPTCTGDRLGRNEEYALQHIWWVQMGVLSESVRGVGGGVCPIVKLPYTFSLWYRRYK